MSGVALRLSGCYTVQHNEAVVFCRSTSVVVYQNSSKGTQAALHCTALQDATWSSAIAFLT